MLTPLASQTRTATAKPARTLYVTTQKFSNWVRMQARFWYCAASSASVRLESLEDLVL